MSAAGHGLTLETASRRPGLLELALDRKGDPTFTLRLAWNHGHLCVEGNSLGRPSPGQVFETHDNVIH